MKETTNEKTSTNIIALATKEIEHTEFYLASQKKLHSKILIFLKVLAKDINISSFSQDSLDLSDILNQLSEALVKINSNIKFLEELLLTLQKALTENTNVDNTVLNIITHFYSVNSENFDNIISVSVDVEHFLESTSSLFVGETKISSPNNSQVHSDLEERNTIFEENTLKISNDIVVLPYTVEELDAILKTNPEKYTCTKDVITCLYTKPTSYYKNASLVRFKEAFKLARTSGAPFNKAFDLAFELLTNYNLHPAIITACKNLKELDVYLSCLEYNELDDFNFFKINYDISLAKTPLNIFSKIKNLAKKVSSSTKT